MTHSGKLLPTKADIELRLFHVGDVPQDALPPRCPQERERAKRFHFARDRRRYLAGRALLRRMLADWSGRAADSLRFGETGNGKPILLNQPDIHFNVSYSNEAILIGVTQQNRLGVDIEWRRPLPEARALAEDCFDKAEQAALHRGQVGMSESDLFLCGWTRKEACVKASALGLTQNPAEVLTGIDTGPKKVAISTLWYAQVETEFQENYIISWASVI